MPPEVKSRRAIIVTGDITIDWNIARDPKRGGSGPLSWDANDTSQCWRQDGGAAMLADVIEGVVNEIGACSGGAFDVVRLKLPGNDEAADVAERGGRDCRSLCPGDPRFHHSYALWEPVKRGKKAPTDAPDVAWRVGEFLGLDTMPEKAARDHLRLPSDPEDAELVVLDDAAFGSCGFRENKELWPSAVSGETCPVGWVLLKMASPVAEGALWEQLVSVCAPRLIVLMTVDDLRRTNVRIGREFSWEQVAQDLYWELTGKSHLAPFSGCAHVIVSLGAAGAVWLSNRAADEAGTQRRECRLLFDPASFEGQWGTEYPGGMIGYGTCLAGGIARQVLLAPEAPDFAQGIQSGVLAMRVLHRMGYGSGTFEEAASAGLAFPTELIVSELAARNRPLSDCVVMDPTEPLKAGVTSTEAPPLWTILDARCAANEGESLVDRALRVVKEGLSPALDGVPLGRFGGLVTADRREIDAYRSIGGVLAEYCRERRKKPISIAVFGPPGSGKSYGVKQLAKSIAKSTSEEIEELEFNLSQFDDPAALIDAMHQVRDAGLSGRVPLVFWDEFDTPLRGEKFGWLRYFLAPMQDGKFQSGQITHHIGRAIFVFAGGVCERMEEFATSAGVRECKGPDFVSRLKGYVDVLGPNPLTERFAHGDRHYVIRRAIILRGLLAQLVPHLFAGGEGSGKRKILQIDPGVLRAFLQIGEYKHGVRSMGAIISMSILAGRERFERSSLPSEAQLDLHVNGLEFLALAEQPDLADEKLVEALAPLVHAAYLQSVEHDRGDREWAWSQWNDLDEKVKEDNRANVRDMLRKLSSRGYAAVPARACQVPPEFTAADIEEMAQMEHMRWMLAKVEDDWTWGPKRDKEKKLNPAICPWDVLTEEELALLPRRLVDAMGEGPLSEINRQVDRDVVSCIPEMLAEFGYAMVKLSIGERATPESSESDGGSVGEKAR